MVEFVLIYWWVLSGLGRHASTLPSQNILQDSKMIFAAAFLFDASISLPKFSALFFSYRILIKTSRSFYIDFWTIGSLNAAWLISAWISTKFLCTSVEKAWSEVDGAIAFRNGVDSWKLLCRARSSISAYLSCHCLRRGVCRQAETKSS